MKCPVQRSELASSAIAKGGAMGLYPIRAVERGLKIQKVILRAVGGEILWCQADEIIGISDRGMRRWKGEVNYFLYIHYSCVIRPLFSIRK
jgi:hypothetical protein